MWDQRQKLPNCASVVRALHARDVLSFRSGKGQRKQLHKGKVRKYC